MRRLAGLTWLLAACGAADPGDTAPTVCADDALSTCQTPQQAPSWYESQGLIYFDTLDASADPDSVPDYAPGVARWEWPPWLKLTGIGRDLVLTADKLIKAADPTVTVPTRDCRAFEVQPFARCKVVMDYDGKPCPIYEEFTFAPDGTVTWVEAWSDLPGLRPTDDASDTWAEAPGAHRLSTRIPGLGGPQGVIDLEGPAMTAAAEADPEVADFVARALDFWPAWSAELAAAGDDLYPRGCGWTP